MALCQLKVSAATNIDVKTLCQHCDTINFCFSKVNNLNLIFLNILKII